MHYNRIKTKTDILSSIDNFALANGAARMFYEWLRLCHKRKTPDRNFAHDSLTANILYDVWCTDNHIGPSTRNIVKQHIAYWLDVPQWASLHEITRPMSHLGRAFTYYVLSSSDNCNLVACDYRTAYSLMHMFLYEIETDETDYGVDIATAWVTSPYNHSLYLRCTMNGYLLPFTYKP